MKILITGGAGYIGTSLANTLAVRKDVDEIVVYDNLSRPNYNFFLGNKYSAPEKIRFVRGELLDSRQLNKVLKGIDIVYHLAAKVTTPFANTDPHFFEQVNHWGSAELVYAIEGSDVKKFIYLSSTSIYGSSKQPVDETANPNPRTFYGISKYRGEEHASRLTNKMETYILRCGNVYGYNKSMRFDAVINKFVFEANFSKQIAIHGDGKQKRSFIHIDQVAKALSNILDNKIDTGIYNLVYRDLSVMDIVDVLKTMIPELEFIFINQHLKLRELLVQSNGDINERLGIASDLTFEKELEMFIERFSF